MTWSSELFPHPRPSTPLWRHIPVPPYLKVPGELTPFVLLDCNISQRWGNELCMCNKYMPMECFAHDTPQWIKCVCVCTGGQGWVSSVPRVKKLTITLPQWWNSFVSSIPVEEEGTNKPPEASVYSVLHCWFRNLTQQVIPCRVYTPTSPLFFVSNINCKQCQILHRKCFSCT